MAQNRQLDIFAAELETKDLIPSTGPAKASGQDVAEARKEWARVPFTDIEKKKLKAERKQTKQEHLLNGVINWKTGPNVRSKKPVKKPIKFGMNITKINHQPNLAVIQKNNAPKTSKDNEKPAPATQTASSTQDMMKKAESPPQKEEAAEAKPQGSGVQGRMTASSFMNVNQAPAHTNQAGTKRSFPQRPPIQMQINNYPKGIPKSFLTPAHQQQLEVRPAVPAAANPEPVWEALPPKPVTSQPQPNWSNVKSRFDQLPSGQYANQLQQIYSDVHEQYISPEGLAPTGRAVGQVYREASASVYDAMSVDAEPQYEEVRQQYSPSDAYADMIPESHHELGSCSPEWRAGAGGARRSAFERLGPLDQPKKPKLTINLTLQNEHAVREVVQESKEEEEKYTPVWERADILSSLDDTVVKYRAHWPWLKPPAKRRTVTRRDSKTVMQLELEQMEPEYERDKYFFEIVVTGYPKCWNKEDVLDAVLEAVKGKSLIPCFIEFRRSECRFLVLRSRPALVALHKLGFTHRAGEVLLSLCVHSLNLSVNQLDFIPRLVLRKRLASCMEGDTTLNLKSFTLDTDISHFVYFPLSRACNQAELMQLQSSVPWHHLTSLVLAHNRISSLSGFELTTHVPRLKHLDVSYNRLASMSELVCVRGLPLATVLLEGNPLCLDFVGHERYTRALKMMFPALKEIDGVVLPVAGEFPPYLRNYSPPGGEAVASKLLDTLFPLLDAEPQHRQLCEDLYMDDAELTITYMHKLRYSAIYKDYFPLFAHARVLDEGSTHAVRGAAAIGKFVQRWPPLHHDPFTFTVDVFYHTDTTTMVRVSGVLKVATDSLAEEEHVLHFTRTLVLHALDAREYKVAHEMLYWDLPHHELASRAFRIITGRSKKLSLKLDGPPDSELRKQLIEIFMSITELDRERSEKCLESKEWHLNNALEYFTRLLKLDTLDVLQ